jgi:hypothetical protein
MEMSNKAAIAYAKRMSERAQQLDEENRELQSEMTGALQLVSYLLQRYAPGGIIIPLKELAATAGSVRVTQNGETLAVVAVTPEQIEQAVAEIAKNGDAQQSEPQSDPELVDAAGQPHEASGTDSGERPAGG